MKILMLNYEYPPIGGGAGNAFRNLLIEYAKRNDLSIDVLTAGQGPKNSVEQFSDAIHIYKVGIHKKNLHFWTKREVIEWLFKAKRQLKKLLSDHQYDLAHAFFGFPTGWLTYYHRKQLPYIISLRGSDVPGYNVRLKLDYYLLKGVFHKIWQNADAVVANSKGLAQLASQFEPELDIRVICNGINTNIFTPPATRTLKGCIKLLTVCRLISRKRIHLLIQAVAHLTQKGVNVELNIVGEGNLLEELKAQATELNIADRVNFLGLIAYNDMPLLYQQNHLFLLSSEHEGMSNAMLEAMASGLPIITAACEGTDELVEKNGKIIQNPTPDSFALSVIEILSDSDTYYKISDASRQKAEQLSWGASARRYLELYHSSIK